MYMALLSLALHVVLADPQTASISGKITTFDEGALGDTVVYLEGAGTFAPSTQPAVITQKGAQFSPSLLVICVGQTVAFKNDEEKKIDHNVFSRSPAKPFDLGFYFPPEAKLVTFDQPGVVRLFCSMHRYMDGTIYVSPTPFFARVNPDGTYKIEHVPAGQWKLKTWQRRARYVDSDSALNVVDGKDLVQNITLGRQ